MKARLSDQKERDLAVEWTQGPILVEASAGTGKTTLFVDRVAHLVREKCVPITEIVAITFTRKATIELKTRIRARLRAALREEEDDDARRRLEEALADLESARISTIHSFALSVVREISVDAGLPPDIGEVDEVELGVQLERVWRDWLVKELDGDDRRLADFLELGFSVADLEKIRDAMLALPEMREYFPSAGRTSPDDIHAAMKKEYLAWEDFAKRHCLDDTDKAFQELARARGWLEGISSLSIIGLMRSLWRPDFKMNKRVGSVKNWDIDAETEKSNLFSFRKKYDRLLEKVAAIAGHKVISGLVSIIRNFVELFERQVREAGLLSYDDILFLAAKLVRENPAARARIRERIRHFLVDEFQDTDPLQVELIFLLTGEGANVIDWREVRMEGANLFLVGDPKQSIYRFRRADIAIYEEVKEKLRRLPKPPELDSRVLHIRENFRSVPGVVEFVNRVFERVITHASGVQPEYVPLVASREASGPRVFLLKLRVDEGEDARTGKTEKGRRECEAACLAEGVRRLVEEKKGEVEDGGSLRPVRYGDVAILFRARTGYAQFEEAFRAAGVPCVLDGGHGFYDKFEVGAVISALSAVTRPGDPLALAAALRSPLYGFSDADVALYLLKDSDPPRELSEAVEELYLLHERKKKLGARALLEEMYRRTGAFELFFSSFAGEQRVANLFKLLDMAETFAQGGRRGTDAFAAHLEARYELGRDAREPEALLGAQDDGAGAVRFMSIYQAKGMEFPVVALADLDGRSASPPETRIVDRQKKSVDLRLGSKSRRLDSIGYADACEREKEFVKAERGRLLYVGATRARDCLLWPVFRGEKENGSFWSLIKEAGLSVEEMEKIPSVQVQAVSPAEPKEPERILRLDGDVFRAGDGETVSLPAERVALAKKLRRLKEPARLRLPLAPSSLIQHHGLRAEERESSGDAFWEDGTQKPESGGGAAFGQLTHSILARLEPPEVVRLDELREENFARARALGLNDEDVALAMKLIRGAMKGGVLARAAAASRRWRETPFVFEMDESFIRGYIDLVFEENGKLIIVDFKTDDVKAGKVKDTAAFYATQGGAYVMGLEAATGYEAHELVFAFLRPGVDVSLPVDDDLREGVRRVVAEAR